MNEASDGNKTKESLREFLSDPKKTILLFKWLETIHKRDLENLQQNEELIDRLRPLFTKDEQTLRLIEYMKKMNDMQKIESDTFQFIFYILEILSTRNVEQPITKPTTEYKPERIELSEEDKKALDWLKNYFKRATGDTYG